MIEISMARAGEGALQAHLMDSMFRLRTEVFHQRLGWDVRVDNGREHDWFDLIGPRYLVAHSRGSQPQALGCCRLLPASGPNMLRDVFPQLLDGAAAPAASDQWEVSRFAVSEHCTEGGFGFSDVPAAMVAAVVESAAQHSISALVGVTSAAFERMLLGLGLDVRRLGRARRIGRVMSLAFELPIHADNLQAIGRYALPTPALQAA
jgi:acyl homoserine lactone synthase